MVEENSVAYIELRDCADILSPLPPNVYASMFVNAATYLVVSNFEEKDYELCLKDVWVDRIDGMKGKVFRITPKSILFLRLDRAC